MEYGLLAMQPTCGIEKHELAKSNIDRYGAAWICGEKAVVFDRKEKSDIGDAIFLII